jgi:hypothetical protein
MTIERLESAAVAAYRRGDTWRDFYHDVGPSIRQAAPGDHAVLDRLLSLVTSGDCDGLKPIEVDQDADQHVDEVHTKASYPWITESTTP